uniref:Smr domain-containing protein n=1 Tax=Caenorhabditis tropicalis TaxID=1561998 RepID=A0A1I7UKL0_9PELO
MERGRVFVMSAAAKAMKEKHQEELQKLHALRVSAVDWRKKVSLEGMINRKVIEYNRKMYRSLPYFDLHGMTFKGAIDFAGTQLGRLKRYEVLRLETGVGKHAKCGFSVIQLALIKANGEDGLRVEKDPHNEGVLVFERQAAIAGRTRQPAKQPAQQLRGVVSRDKWSIWSFFRILETIFKLSNYGGYSRGGNKRKKTPKNKFFQFL